MNLLEMIDELKDTHDEELFKKTVDRLESLIYEEIRHSSDSEEANILEKEDYYYQELEEFIKSENSFRDLIEFNIINYESLSKAVGLVKELKELQLRKGKYDFFNTNIEEAMNEITIESFGLLFEPDYSCYYKYAELSPYMKLNPYILMFDDYVGIEALSDYLLDYDVIEKDFYNNIEFDQNIESNREQLEELQMSGAYFQFDAVRSLCDGFFYLDHSDHDLLVKSNGLLKHYIENNMIELFDDTYFINTLQSLKNHDFLNDKNKSKDRDSIIKQFKAAILEKLSKLKNGLDNNIDKEEVLKNVKILCNEFFLDELFNNSFLIFELNDIFSKLEEKRT